MTVNSRSPLTYSGGARAYDERWPEGSNTEGWGSFDALSAQLERDGEPPLVVDGQSGRLVRRVPQHTGESYDDNGVKLHRLIWVPRGVALTLEEAQAARMKGEERDYYSGAPLGWIRRGVKAEKDAGTYARPGGSNILGEEFVPAGPEEQAAYRGERAMKSSGTQVPPLSEAPRRMADPSVTPVATKRSARPSESGQEA